MRLFNFEKLPVELRTLVRSRDLKTGERLYSRGDPADAVFCVVSGFLRLLNHTPEGTTVPLYVIGPGEYVSEAALFADHYCSDAIAEMPSRVSIYPKAPLLAALEKDPVLAREFMALQSRRFNLLRARMELRSIRSARKRVLQYLEIAKLPESSVSLIDRPLRSIAEDIGLTHETLYRTIAALKREGLVHQASRRGVRLPHACTVPRFSAPPPTKRRAIHDLDHTGDDKK